MDELLRRVESLERRVDFLEESKALEEAIAYERRVEGME
jgi:hypothetical protein